MNLSCLFEKLLTEDAVLLDPSWTQGRALFGGLTAALMLAKMRAFTANRPLRSAAISFVGPIDATQSVTLAATVLRTGSAVMHMQAQLVQNGAVQAAMLASFGSARASSITMPLAVAPKWPHPDMISPLPTRGEAAPEFIPKFMQHIDMRWAAGDLPFSGGQSDTIGGYLRLQGQSGVFTTEHLLTLGDAWPPALTVLASQPVPTSSMTWTFDLVNEPNNMGVEDFWRYQAVIQSATDGYGVTEAKMWDKEGKLCVLSRQTITIFA